MTFNLPHKLPNNVIHGMHHMKNPSSLPGFFILQAIKGYKPGNNSSENYE